MKTAKIFPTVMTVALAASVLLTGCRNKDQEPDNKPKGEIRPVKVEEIDTDGERTSYLLQYDADRLIRIESESDGGISLTFNYFNGKIEKKAGNHGTPPGTPERLVSRSTVDAEGFITQVETFDRQDQPDYVSSREKLTYENGRIARIDGVDYEDESDEGNGYPYTVLFTWKDGNYDCLIGGLSIELTYSSEPCRSAVEVPFLLGMDPMDAVFDYMAVGRGFRPANVISRVLLPRSATEILPALYTYRWDETSLTLTAVIRTTTPSDREETRTLIIRYAKF